ESPTRHRAAAELRTGPATGWRRDRRRRRTSRRVSPSGDCGTLGWVSRRTSVMLAARDDGEVDGVRPVVVAFEQVAQRAQLLDGQVDGAPTQITNEMVMMATLGEMDDAGAVPQMDVMDDPRLLESVDRSIDRGEVDRPAQNLLGAVLQLRHRE